MHTPTGTNVSREWGSGKCQPWCVCGWTGRTRNLNDDNRVKAVKDCFNHASKCNKR